jgi:hypothetical protein
LGELTINDVYQVNTGNSKILIKWERISVNIPSAWDYSMCDLGACHPGIPVGPEEMDTVKVGNSGFLGLNIDPGNTPGSGVVKVLVYQNGFRNNADTITWNITAVPAGIKEIQENNPLRIFPNPAGGQLHISIGTPGEFSVSITDLTGRNVLRILQPGGPASIDLSSLEKGIYTVHVISEQKAFSKKLIKE